MKHPVSLVRGLTIRLVASYAVLLVIAVLGLVIRGEVTGASEHRHPLGPGARALRSAPVAELAAHHALIGFVVWDMASDRPLLQHPPSLALDPQGPGIAPIRGHPRARGDFRQVHLGDRGFTVGFYLDESGSRGTLSWLRDELQDEILPVVLPLIAASLLVVPLTIHRALRPLSDAARQLEQATARSEALHYPAERLPREVRPFVEATSTALKRLAAVIDRQRRFTADAAHALRTPLTALRLRLDMLPALPEKPALLASADRLATLTQRLLRLARLERHDGVMEPTDLGALAREVCTEFDAVARARKRSLALDVTAPIPLVVIDREAMREALENLIDNALHAAPEGSVVEVAAGPGAAVEVRDRGTGLPHGDIGRIFEPFARGADSRYGGSGLGLAIVREVMAVHGGEASLEPRPGGGTVARLSLPSKGAC